MQIFVDHKVLASGTQAKVVNGKTSSGVPVAIKIFPKTPKGQNNFMDEAKIISNIRDKSNIVQVVSISYTDCYIAMKKYDCDLFSYCFEDEKIGGESDCKKILKEICKSLHGLHSSGVAHLDIKPENILVDLHSKKFKLCDFGLSYHSKTNDRKEKVDGKIGTEQYIAPEVIQNSYQSYNPFSADIYSIGCVFYGMLTGCFYDPQENNDVVFPDHAQISPQGKEFIAQLLATNPEKRPTIEQILASSYLNDNQFVLRKKLHKLQSSIVKVVFK